MTEKVWLQIFIWITERAEENILILLVNVEKYIFLTGLYCNYGNKKKKESKELLTTYMEENIFTKAEVLLLRQQKPATGLSWGRRTSLGYLTTKLFYLSQVFSSFKFVRLMILLVSHFSHATVMSLPSHRPWLDHPNIMWLLLFS